MGQHPISMIIPFHSQQRPPVSLPKFHHPPRQLKRRKVPPQFRALQSEGPFDHLCASVVTLRTTPCRVHTNDVLTTFLGREKNDKPFVVLRLHCSPRTRRGALDRLQIENAFSRCKKAGTGILRILLTRQLAQHLPLLAPPRDLPFVDTVLIHQVALFLRKRENRSFTADCSITLL